MSVLRRLTQFIERLRSALRSEEPRSARRASPTSFATAPVPDWHPGHRDAWNAFLRTPTGQVLMGRMRGLQGAVATRACADVFHTSHSAGTANGWHEALQWLESLASTKSISQLSGDIDGGQPDRNSANDKQASVRRDELLELYAP